MQLLYLDPRQLEADPEGVREDPGDVAGLAATIAERGLLQPLGVVAAGGGRYRVVYGGRRRAAAIQLGLERVPCIVLDADDPDLLLRQLIENVQRQDLNDVEQARAYDVTHRIVLPDGEIRIVRESGEVVRDQAGRPQRMIGTVQDVTEQTRVEQALRESEQKLRTVIEGFPVVLWAIDRDGTFTLSRGAGLKLLGLEPDQVLSRLSGHRERRAPSPGRRKPGLDPLDRAPRLRGALLAAA